MILRPIAKNTIPSNVWIRLGENRDWPKPRAFARESVSVEGRATGPFQDTSTLKDRAEVLNAKPSTEQRDYGSRRAQRVKRDAAYLLYWKVLSAHVVRRSPPYLRGGA